MIQGLCLWFGRILKLYTFVFRTFTRQRAKASVVLNRRPQKLEDNPLRFGRRADYARTMGSLDESTEQSDQDRAELLRTPFTLPGRWITDSFARWYYRKRPNLLSSRGRRATYDSREALMRPLVRCWLASYPACGTVPVIVRLVSRDRTMRPEKKSLLNSSSSG